MNQNGQTVSFSSPAGLTITGSSGAGSAISTLAIPAYGPSIDVAALVQTDGVNCSGSYVLYTSASSNALLNPSGGSTGTFTALVLTVTNGGSGCTGSFELKYKNGASEVTGLEFDRSVEAYNNGFYIGLVSKNGGIQVYNWGRHLAGLWVPDGFMAGNPGIGGWNMPSGTSMKQADLGAVEWGAPNPMNAADIAVTTTPNRVDFQFGGTTDDAAGKGMSFYMLYRRELPSGYYQAVGELITSFGQYADQGVLPGVTYEYLIYAYDFHANYSTVTFSATTPPAGSADPRRVGLSPTAATWGALGANVDLLSGNVNYNLPLLKAQARGGCGGGFWRGG